MHLNLRNTHYFLPISLHSKAIFGSYITRPSTSPTTVTQLLWKIFKQAAVADQQSTSMKIFCDGLTGYDQHQQSVDFLV
jgi:hypothetical protein